MSQTITVPPMQGQPTVVHVQPQHSTVYPNRGIGTRNWHSGLFGCCDDIVSCCLGYFCLPCLACMVAGKIDESCFVPTCVQGGVIAMRTKVRMVLGIQGSICGDAIVMSCCTPCAMCQLHREVKDAW